MTSTITHTSDQLDANAVRVIREMATCHDDKRPYVRTIARDIGMPVEQLRRILQQLTKCGLATYGPVFDSADGRPAGSTYWLTEAGAALQNDLTAGSVRI